VGRLLLDGVHSLHPLIDADDIEVTIQSTDPILDCVKDIPEKRSLSRSVSSVCLRVDILSMPSLSSGSRGVSAAVGRMIVFVQAD
jgi:hypothetical protein